MNFNLELAAQYYIQRKINPRKIVHMFNFEANFYWHPVHFFKKKE